MNYVTPQIFCNTAPVIGSAFMLLISDIPDYFRNDRVEKTIYFFASSIFLQIGSQALGYMATMAWCGMTVNPILVTAVYAVTITSIFLISQTIIAHRGSDQLLKQIIRAVFTFACSFFLNLTLIKFYEDYEIARNISFGKIDESMKTISESISAIFQQTVPHSLLTKFLKLILISGAKTDIHLKNMSTFGYTPLHHLCAGSIVVYAVGILITNMVGNLQNLLAVRERH